MKNTKQDPPAEWKLLKIKVLKLFGVIVEYKNVFLPFLLGGEKKAENCADGVEEILRNGEQKYCMKKSEQRCFATAKRFREIYTERNKC